MGRGGNNGKPKSIHDSYTRHDGKVFLAQYEDRYDGQWKLEWAKTYK